MSEIENTVPVDTRLPASMADKLGKVASAADRTIAAEVRRAVREYLDSREVSAGKAA